MLNDKRIKSCLSRFDSGAYSRLQFLRAVSHSVGAHAESLQPRDDNSSSSSSENEDEDRQAPVPAATTSGASELATAAAATTSDDCSEVCLVAPRAGFALFYSAPKRCPESNQLSLPHVGITNTEIKRTINFNSMSSSYNTPCSKHKLGVSIYSNTETSFAMSTLAVWCRVIMSRDFSAHSTASNCRGWNTQNALAVTHFTALPRRPS